MTVDLLQVLNQRRLFRERAFRAGMAALTLVVLAVLVVALLTAVDSRGDLLP